MDKKNTTIGILLFVAAIVCWYVSYRYAPPPTSPAAVQQAVAQQAVAQQAAAAGQPPPAAPTESAFASVSTEHAGAREIELENQFIRVSFSNFGGAIRDVSLEKYPAAQDSTAPFVFNQEHKDPMLALVDLPGLDRNTAFAVVSQTATEVVYRATLDGRLEVTRRYDLSPDQVGTTDPYEIHAETTFRNLAATPSAPLTITLALGTGAPVNPADNGYYLTTGYSNGHSTSFIRRSQLEQSNGIFGFNAHEAAAEIVKPGPFKWASVSSQFFASVLTPNVPAESLVTRRIKLFSDLPDSDPHAYGITADAQFDLGVIAPHGSTTLSSYFYVGPKEYHRLSNQDVFKADQEKVMQYGGTIMTFFSGILITLMTWTHSFVGNWGVAIICTTLILKIATMPFTLMSARSARRMQKIQPQLKALKEKFKDNPQKQQAATMELFKEHKVNPMGGCLPMLVTMPFFFAFYTMLRSTAELRFAHFLWARDLSAPDTIGHLFGLPINVLPVLVTAASFFQMQFTPQPTVDSSQAKMMKFMPLVTLFFYYTYACSLSVYSTTNYLFSIGQQLMINRAKDDGDPADAPKAAAAVGKNGRPMKNVTPRRKA